MDKILKIQREIGKLSKDKENPFFHSSYFDINQILDKLNPLLEKHGLMIVQPLTTTDQGRPALGTVIYDESGKEVFNTLIALPELNDPQKMGSAITYYRRYALQSFFLLQAEDNDGDIGQNKKVEKKETTKEYQARMKLLKDNGGDPTQDDL